MTCEKLLKKCGAMCCRFIVVEWKPFTGLEDDALFFSLRGIKLDKENMQLLIPCRCKWLSEHNRCRMYAYRPKSCIAYKCEYLKTESLITNHEAKA